MRPFGLSKSLSRSFAKPVSEYLPEYFDRKELFEAEYEDLESLAQLALPDIVVERIERLRLPFSADEMSERVIYNDGSKVIVAGLRFKNLDVQYPFVSLKLNFRANVPGTVPLIRQLILDCFEESSPRGFLLVEAPDLELSQTAVWNAVLARPLTSGESIEPSMTLPAGYELRPEQNSSAFYSNYSDEYATWAEKYPEIAIHSRVESKEDLNNSASKSLLVCLQDEHGWAGLAAGKSSPLFGKRALHLTELFLSERNRGFGLGEALEAELLNSARNQFDLAWGHVHHDNKTALETALRLGRKKVQQEYFFTLDV